MNKLFVSLLLLFVWFYSPVYAQDEQIFEWVIGNERKFASLRIHNDYEISGKLVRVNNLFIPEKNFRPFCHYVIREKGEDRRIFDFEAYKNGNLIDKDGNVFMFNDESINASRTEEKCYNLSKGDILEIKYSLGNKVKGIHSNYTFVSKLFTDLGLRMDEERYYPFDKYNLTMWTSLFPFNFLEQSAKVSLPPSYDFTFNKSSFTCPLLSKRVLYNIIENKTSNETKQKELMKVAMFGYYQYLASQQTFLEQISGIEKNVKPFGDIVCSPLDEEIKEWVKWYWNMTSDFNEVRDLRTGVYIYVEYGRPELIKFFFWVSIILQLSIAILIMSSNETKIIKTEKILIATFTIWTFQEGLNILSPIIRPLILTVYDLTPIASLIIIAWLWFKRE